MRIWHVHICIFGMCIFDMCIFDIYIFDTCDFDIFDICIFNIFSYLIKILSSKTVESLNLLINFNKWNILTFGMNTRIVQLWSERKMNSTCNSHSILFIYAHALVKGMNLSSLTYWLNYMVDSDLEMAIIPERKLNSKPGWRGMDGLHQAVLPKPQHYCYSCRTCSAPIIFMCQNLCDVTTSGIVFHSFVSLNGFNPDIYISNFFFRFLAQGNNTGHLVRNELMIWPLRYEELSVFFCFRQYIHLCVKYFQVVIDHDSPQLTAFCYCYSPLLLLSINTKSLSINTCAFDIFDICILDIFGIFDICVVGIFDICVKLTHYGSPQLPTFFLLSLMPLYHLSLFLFCSSIHTSPGFSEYPVSVTLSKHSFLIMGPVIFSFCLLIYIMLIYAFMLVPARAYGCVCTVFKFFKNETKIICIFCLVFV